MCTHILKNTYHGNNKFIDLLSLSWLRRDLRNNINWQVTIRNIIKKETNHNIEEQTHTISNSSLDINLLEPKFLHNIPLVKYNILDNINIINSEHIDTDECWICTESMSNYIVWSCKHAFCRNCTSKMLALKMPCPLCRVVPTYLDEIEQ